MDDFGGRLREAREQRGVSLRQIADRTRISIVALEALERNDVSRLPGGIFSRAFVRSYAAEVGLDPEQTVRAFVERFQAEPTAEAGRPRMKQREAHFESGPAFPARPVLIAVALILAAAGVYYAARQLPFRTPEPAPSLAQASALPAPEAPAREAAAAQRQPAPAVVAAVQKPMMLVLSATADCWVRLTVDGETRLSKVLAPGETFTQPVNDFADLSVGDAGALGFSIDGRQGHALGLRGQVRTVRITRATLAQFVE